MYRCTYVQMLFPSLSSCEHTCTVYIYMYTGCSSILYMSICKCIRTVYLYRCLSLHYHHEDVQMYRCMMYMHMHMMCTQNGFLQYCMYNVGWNNHPGFTTTTVSIHFVNTVHSAPQVQFEQGSYTLEPPLTSVPVCIVSTTPEEGAPAFSVSVSVTTGI